jgi:hypothetical protein
MLRRDRPELSVQVRVGCDEEGGAEVSELSVLKDKIIEERLWFGKGR